MLTLTRRQDAAVASRLLDQPETEPPTTPTPAPSSRLGTVFVFAGAGLFVTGLGDALARSGHQSPALPMFFAGLIAVFVPCAWRLTSGAAARRERVAVSLVLGVGMLLSYYIRSPLIFDWFDELIHGVTLNSLLDNRTLLVHNSILPVSPYYPGLELVTIAVKWMTGLPVALAELVVVLVTRVVLVLCVFLVVERVCGSARAGGIGVLVYAASPTFYTFASWDYGPVALALAVAAIHFLLSSIDERSPRAKATLGLDALRSPAPTSRRGALHSRRDFWLAIASITALVATHHLTAWLTAALLVAWAIGLRIVGRRDHARVIGSAAATNVVLVGGWSAFVGSHLVSYLSPLLGEATTGFASLVGQLHGNRKLFQTSSSQGGSAPWEIVVMVAAVVCFCLMLCPSVLAAIRKRTVGGGALRYLPVVVAAGYPFAMLASLSSGSSEVGERTTTFFFFGMAIVIGGWLATRIASKRGLLETVGTVLVATVCLLGGMIFGSGPASTYVPGPYLVGANQRSVGAPSLAVAQWVSTHLPAGVNVAADRQNGALLADIGHINMVTGISGLVDASPLFFSGQFDSNELSLIRKDHIDYIVMDRRLASSLPLFGTYLSQGEAKAGTRLTIAELTKFDSVPGVSLVYDNGPIQVYDLSTLLGPVTTARTTDINYGAAPEATNWAVLSAVLGTGAILILLRFRRRRRAVGVTEGGVLTAVMMAALLGFVFSAVFIPQHVSPTVLGLSGLGLVVAVALVLAAKEKWSRRSVSDHHQARGAAKSGPVVTMARYGIVVGIVLTGLGLLVATTTATREWQPVPALSLSTSASGALVADVDLGSQAPTSARLVIPTPSGVPVVRVLPRNVSVQHVVLPPWIRQGDQKVFLVTPGWTREVSS